VLLRSTTEAVGAALEVVPQSPILEVICHTREITSLRSIDSIGVVVSGDQSGLLALSGCASGGCTVPDFTVRLGDTPVQCISGMDGMGNIYAACGRGLICVSVNGAWVAQRVFHEPIVHVEVLDSDVLVVLVQAAVLIKSGTLETGRTLLSDGKLDEAAPGSSYIGSARVPAGSSTIVMGLSDGRVGLVAFG